MANEAEKKLNEEIKDLPKKDQPLSADDLDGVVGGMKNSPTGSGGSETCTFTGGSEVDDT